MKQLIQIGLTTSSASECFRILKVYLEPKESQNPVLIVVSKRSDPPGCLGVATTGRHDASVEVEIPGNILLPVRHYVIGLRKKTSIGEQKDPEELELEEASTNHNDFLPDVPFRRLPSQKDLILSEAVQVLYENPNTEETEQKMNEEFWNEEIKLLTEYKKTQENNLNTDSVPLIKDANKSPLIRPDSPHVADASACVGSHGRFEQQQSDFVGTTNTELPLYVKAMACVSVGLFGIVFFQCL